MLVLSRQKDEVIWIGDDIRIMIVDIRGDKVRVGIEAPSHIPVNRAEVRDIIKQEEERVRANLEKNSDKPEQDG